MLLSPAYAAESGASDSSANAAVTTAAEARSVKTLTGVNGDTVKEIFRSRLDALGCKDYTLTVADDGSAITVSSRPPHRSPISQIISCSRRPFPHPTRTARYG